MEIKNRNIDNITRVKVAGITGGIASGKTVATDALSAAGFCVADADDISRELFGRGTEGERALMSMFPSAVKDGALDRRALRDIISADEKARKLLDGYTHPLIRSEVERRIQKEGAVIVSAPLLFESGFSDMCGLTVCVTAPLNVRIARLRARDGVSESAARAIINAQMSDSERTARADFVISSDRPMSEFTAEVVGLFKRIME